MRFFSKKLFIGIVLVGYIHAKDLASIETALGVGSGIRLPCRFSSSVRFAAPVFDTLDFSQEDARLRIFKIQLGISRHWGTFSF